MPEITQESIDQANRTLADSLRIYDHTTQTTQDIRHQLVAKLLPVVTQMDLRVDRSTDPDLYQAQARMISETRSLLNDMDTSDRNNAAMKLKQKDTEINASNTINAAEFLAAIKLTGGVPISDHPPMSPTEVDTLLEKQFTEQGCFVLETELEAGQNQLPERRVGTEEF